MSEPFRQGSDKTGNLGIAASFKSCLAIKPVITHVITHLICSKLPEILLQSNFLCAIIWAGTECGSFDKWREAVLPR